MIYKVPRCREIWDGQDGDSEFSRLAMFYNKAQYEEAAVRFTTANYTRIDNSRLQTQELGANVSFDRLFA